MLHVVRHGRTEVNAAGEFFGRRGPEIDQNCREEAGELAKPLGEGDLVIFHPPKTTMGTGR